MSIQLNRRPFAFGDLHPEVQGQFRALAEDLVLAYQTDRTEFRLEPFEGLRSPARQDHLFTERTTKARAWQSAHQFGLAVDFVPRVLRGIGDDARWQWHWPIAEHNDWQVLSELAAHHGLMTPVPGDKAHVQHPFWQQIRKTWKT